MPFVRFSRDAGLARSVRLFRSFLTEQTDPDGFYSLIADDAVALVAEHVDLAGATVADFGGGPGFYSQAFRDAGATTVLIDADIDEIRLHGRRTPGSVVGVAERAPLADGAVDLAFSSNLLEHVSDLGAVSDEIARVVRPGGVVVLSYTIWLGPWGGHETSPWHLLGGHRAARRYERKNGKPPKNVFGTSMFAASVKDGLAWLRSRPDLEVLDLRPRYLPRWSAFLLRVPFLRELVTWNLWIVVRKPV
ncbi:methyltransferase domain-containing protein [Nocardioides marmoriginsengisoli]|uniref:Methyltransferase domain-containing protein n=1 Tax=Nocardioides marmoriginsengisoli TaxID=661483 RepID=A0A3N0CN82_9ACTN|nr:methyltransferase domain-containing protein [Nocardioides marmoriginsengisoli]